MVQLRIISNKYHRHVAMAPRSQSNIQVREGGAECVAHVEVRAVFGAPDIEAARHTAVIQLFQGENSPQGMRLSWEKM